VLVKTVRVMQRPLEGLIVTTRVHAVRMRDSSCNVQKRARLGSENMLFDACESMLIEALRALFWRP
jgi:hypothetical protein